MNVEYALLGINLLDSSRILAIPADKLPAETSRYHRIGVASLQEEDFRQTSSQPYSHLPVHFLGNLGKANADVSSRLEETIRAFADAEGLDVGRMVAHGQPLIVDAPNFDTVKGDLYIARFVFGSGLRPKEFKGSNASLLYLINPEEGRITVEEKEPSLDDIESMGGVFGEDGKPAAITIVRLNGSYKILHGRTFGVNPAAYKDGSLSLERVGHVEATRKLLVPYNSKGQYGSTGATLPCLVLERNFKG